MLLIGLFIFGTAFADPPDCPPGHHNIDSCNDDDSDGDGNDGDINVTVEGNVNVDQEINVSVDVSGNADAPGNSITINETRPSKIEIKNVPSTRAPNVLPTVPCGIGGSGALSLAGLGVSGGGVKVNKACEKRETIRLAAEMGLMDRATFMWCSLDTAVTTFTSLEACLGFDSASLQEIIDQTQTKLSQCGADLSRAERKADRIEEALMSCLQK